MRTLLLISLVASAAYAGFPRLVPRLDPNCDTGKFQLSDAVYDMVAKCQGSRSAEQDLKKCILDALPEDANALKVFLDRDEYTIAGISSSFSIVSIGDEISQKRHVTFRLCPLSDERNTEKKGPLRTWQPPQLPATSPLFPSRRQAFGYDPETCVKQTFQLPKEQFDKARACQLGGSESFRECLSGKLRDYEESKELLKFVSPEDMVMVDSRFFSSASNINGKVTRKNKIQLTRCKKVEVEEDAGEEDQDQDQEEEENTPQETS